MKATLLAFNRGRISRLALARADFKRTALSGEIMTNWMPRALGSMMLRPGWAYKGATRGNALAVTIPFIFAVDDTARLEMTDGQMRVWVDDALVTRPTVSTAILNGTFDVDLADWTDEDEAGAVSDWVVPGFMRLRGTGNNAARRRQFVICANPGVRHAVNISVNRGPLKLRIGSTAGGEEYVEEALLFPGEHSLAFTPTGDFYIELFCYTEHAALVDSVTIAPAGIMEISTPWVEAALPNLRWDQSGDVVFVACTGYRQRRIERRAVDSWSVVTYQCDNGPFKLDNIGPITMTPSVESGDGDLTASAPFFRVGHVGALFRLTQSGQSASETLTGADQWSDPIRITGVDGQRVFAVIITGTFSATVTLQYSVAEPGSWVDAASGSFSGPTAISYDDTLDNQVLYYRIGIKAGDYTSGTAEAKLSTPSGSQTGICRVNTIASETVANVSVLSAFGDVTATDEWAESYWSDESGYPSAGALHEGRLWWGGRDRMWASVSDDFHNFDDTVEGDSGPISRSIGKGPVDTVYWMLSLQRLLFGCGGKVWSIRSSSLDEPITPTNFNLKPATGQGAANVPAVELDKNGAYLQRSGQRLFEVAIDAEDGEYGASDLAAHVPEIGEPSITRIVVQRQPETRLHCIRADGTVGILIFDKREEIQCWVDIETDGSVEDACVEPGEVEDKVTYTVRRTVNGTTVRYFERWAQEAGCRGDTLNHQADSYVVSTGDGLDHLEGMEVIAWGGGEDLGTFTVTGGAIALDREAVIGLPYEARFKSAKLAAIVEGGAALLCEKKRISRIGVVAADIHAQGVQYGPDFDTMDDLPLIEDGARLDLDAIRDAYDEPMFTFSGRWDTDCRVCLKAQAPRPATLLAAVIEI
ncbi:hypothetical protein GG804_24970 [Sphingomonas histidinilytica]|uniref:hypothetical protein n=1 Tax=Rhizorhabdus histidinilytica TaxID=439228 RepID=UPI001ADCAAAC|nr:hypothetical protein [Rhizorhabdus histidinilytica]MBO9380024.1 hypothetical protein [Rhizorhabdus histidinilytica]